MYNIGILMLEMCCGIPFPNFDGDIQGFLEFVDPPYEIRDIIKNLIDNNPNNRPSANKCSRDLRKILSAFKELSPSNVAEELQSVLQSLSPLTHAHKRV